MSRRKWLVALPALIAIAIFAFPRPHPDRLAFLRPHVLYEKVCYLQPSSAAPPCVVHKMVVRNLSDEKVADLFNENLKVGDGWRAPRIEKDPPGYLSISTYHGQAYRCRLASAGIFSMGTYQRAHEAVFADRYYGIGKGRYEVFASQDLNVFQVLWLKLRNIGRDPYEHWGSDVDPQAI